MQNGPSPRRLNLIINLTGAVSAGTYAAGALDFLVEALDELSALREAQSIPPHEVVVTGLSGASAGAQTAVIFAASIAYRFPHVRVAPAAESAARSKDRSPNPFFRHWVEMNDLSDYLTTRDEPVQSVLDSTHIEEVVQSVLAFGSGLVRVRRRWVADHLRLGMALTNLRGMPTSYARQPTPGKMEFTRHVDSMYFTIKGVGSACAPGPVDKEEQALSMPETAREKQCGWYPTLGRACIASGAFPIAFAPRTVTRPTANYKTPGSHALPPEDSSYRFCAVDGGLFDDDPKDIAHRLCEASHSAGEMTVLLTIGSPMVRAAEGPSTSGAMDLFKVARALFDAVWYEARLRPDTLTSEDDPSPYARSFLLSPRAREDEADFKRPGGNALAGAGLWGFAGYFAREFRTHDFMLGRSNMRAALRNYLCLDENDRLFDCWTAQQKDEHRVRNRSTDKYELPIIPLVGSVAPPPDRAASLPFDSATKLGKYRPAMRRRVFHVLRGLPPQPAGLIRTVLCWLIAWPAAWLLVCRLQKSLRKSIQDMDRY